MTEDAQSEAAVNANEHVRLAEAKMLFAEAAAGRDKQVPVG